MFLFYYKLCLVIAVSRHSGGGAWAEHYPAVGHQKTEHYLVQILTDSIVWLKKQLKLDVSNLYFAISLLFLSEDQIKLGNIHSRFFFQWLHPVFHFLFTLSIQYGVQTIFQVSLSIMFKFL